MNNRNKIIKLQNNKNKQTRLIDSILKADKKKCYSTFDDVTISGKSSYGVESRSKKYLERYISNEKFNDCRRRIVRNLKLNDESIAIFPFLQETEVNIDSKTSKCPSSSKSSRYLESKYTSDLETDFFRISYIKSAKSMRKLKSSKTKLLHKNVKLKDLSITDTPLQLTSKAKICVDKTTFCQPTVNYNQEFIYKTIEKNFKLKKLVNKLLLSQRQDNENMAWNDYINELKDKHCSYSNKSKTIPSSNFSKTQIDPEMIEDFKNTKFSWKQSIPCSNLLEDLYGTYSTSQRSHEQYKHSDKVELIIPQNRRLYVPFEKTLFCYPTCSQGRLIMLNREKQKRDLLRQRLLFESEHNIRRSDKFKNNINDESVGNIKLYDKQVNTNVICENVDRKKYATISNQTDFKSDLLVTQAKDNKNRIINSKSVDVKTNLMDIVKGTADTTENNCTIHQNHKSLTNIETKLEILIESLNKYINEFRNRNVPESKCVSISCKMGSKNKRVNNPKSKSIGISSENLVNRSVLDSSSGSIVSPTNTISQIKLLTEEKVFKKIEPKSTNPSSSQMECLEDYYKKQMISPCNVKIKFELPTKDCCTEVTRSLSNQGEGDKNDSKEVITPANEDSNHHMTIAINTDPLSVFSLISISTDTIRKFLSYMPNINYCWYSSFLQFPSILKHRDDRNVCNICGADFNKPSELNDHIQCHYLEKTKDCCVCRHVLDRPRRSPGFFTCHYCGQKFTRAYCCELHEQTCARRLGHKHDVSPSLTMLH